MTEEITSRLAVVDGLSVRSRTSVVNYDQTGKTMRQIGDDLGAEYILDGTVRWDRRAEGPGRVRITPRLIRAADDTHVWSDIYDRELLDVFAIQTDIAVAIIQKLGVTLLDRQRDALEARPTENMDAHEAYLRGMDFYRRRPGYQILANAQHWFERAVELDPGFALAYAGLSEVHSTVVLGELYRLGHSQDRMVMSKEAADNALRLDPALPEAHKALGSYFYRCEMDWDKAMEQYEIAKKNRPDDAPLLYMIANVQRQQGEWEASVVTYKKAFELDPRSPLIPKEIAYTLMFLRRYEEAVSYCDRLISMGPDYVGWYKIKAEIFWLWHGDTRRAREILNQMPEVPLTKDPVFVFYSHFRQELYERDYESALQRVASLPVAVSDNWQCYWPKTGLAGLVHHFKGETELARASFHSARAELEVAAGKRPDDCRVHSSLGIAYAGLGKKDDAIREGKLAAEFCPQLVLVGARTGRIKDLAFIYVLVGEYDAALDQIEHLLSIPSFFSVGLLALDPKWDPLRDHPRYNKLLERHSPKQSNTDT
jgi:TolB-like protein/Flp pilus assembly protein TadD